MPITPATGSLADAATGFAGQYLGDATGLYDMRARDYDPRSGRFTATDPVAVPTGTAYFSGYTYGYNNPLMFTDPTGLFSIGDAWDIYKGGVRAYKDLILNDLALTQPNLGGWADKRRYDMARGFMLGVEEDGYWVRINESFNPALQALQSGDAAITAWQEGDYDGVGYNGGNTTVAVAATVGIACVVAKGATNVATKPTVAEPVPPVAKPPTSAEPSVFRNLAPDDVVRLNGFNPIAPSSLRTASGRFNYIVDTEGRLVLGNRRYGHIDLANGADVLAAGEVRVGAGEVVSINNASGHYKPKGLAAQTAAEQAFRSSGLKVRPGAYVEVP